MVIFSQLLGMQELDDNYAISGLLCRQAYSATDGLFMEKALQQSVLNTLRILGIHLQSVRRNLVYETYLLMDQKYRCKRSCNAADNRTFF